MASATLRNDFNACVNLYKDFIEQSDDLGVHDAKHLVSAQRQERCVQWQW